MVIKVSRQGRVEAEKDETKRGDDEVKKKKGE